MALPTTSPVEGRPFVHSTQLGAWTCGFTAWVRDLATVVRREPMLVLLTCLWFWLTSNLVAFGIKHPVEVISTVVTATIMGGTWTWMMRLQRRLDPSTAKRRRRGCGHGARSSSVSD